VDRIHRPVTVDSVPLLAAAVLPHPPALVPEIAAGAAAELDDLRNACDQAIDEVLATAPEVVCIVGGADATTEYWFPYRASFADWGVPVEVHLGDPGPDTPALPLSVAVGVWLVRRGRTHRPTGWRVVTIDRSASPPECAGLGEQLTRSPSVALLVLGDGSACRTLKAPGYLDPRAEPFDTSVTKALGEADPAALLALDPVLGTELMVAGRAPWQVLAGAATTSFDGDVRYDAAPYGVQYTVATWLPR
jgi:hypothetical protein